MPDILGYARVSTEGQDLEGQRQRLREVGALKIFEDVISGKIFIRNGLENLIAYARPNDLLILDLDILLGYTLTPYLPSVIPLC